MRANCGVMQALPVMRDSNHDPLATVPVDDNMNELLMPPLEESNDVR